MQPVGRSGKRTFSDIVSNCAFFLSNGQIESVKAFIDTPSPTFTGEKVKQIVFRTVQGGAEDAGKNIGCF
jgi:hypothetical protein